MTTAAPALFASLAGLLATRLRLHVPGLGAWVANVELDKQPQTPLTGAVTLVVGDLTLAGTIDPTGSGSFAAQGLYRVVAGAGGWGSVLPAKAYHNDAGIKVATLLADAAREAGETLTVQSTVGQLVQGVDFVRELGPASRIFQALDPASTWWVGYDGVTVVGQRPAVTPGPGLQFDLIDYSPQLRTVTFATETPSAIQVGATIIDSRLTNPLTVRELELELGDTCRITAWVDEAGALGVEDQRLVRVFRTPRARDRPAPRQPLPLPRRPDARRAGRPPGRAQARRRPRYDARAPLPRHGRHVGRADSRRRRPRRVHRGQP